MKCPLLLVVIVHLFFIHTSICCPGDDSMVRKLRLSYGGQIYPTNGDYDLTSHSYIVFVIPRFSKNKHRIKPGGIGSLRTFRKTKCLNNAASSICPSKIQDTKICWKSDHSALSLTLTTNPSKRPGYARVVAMWKFKCRNENRTAQTIKVTTYKCGSQVAPSQKLFNVRRNATSFRVLNVRANSNVSLRLEVHTDSGGPFSIEKDITTPPSVPTGPPLNVTRIIKRRIRKLTFRWQDPKCERQNGDIEAFDYILYRSTFPRIKTGNTTSYNMTFRGLRLNEHFSFDVRAKTSKGAGPYSKPLGGYF